MAETEELLVEEIQKWKKMGKFTGRSVHGDAKEDVDWGETILQGKSRMIERTLCEYGGNGTQSKLR